MRPIPPGGAEAVLRLGLVGAFTVERAGTSLDREIGRGKASVLLKILSAARGELVSMDALLETLWHGSPPAKAEANVASLVSRLRHALGPGVIDGGRHGYRVVRGPAVTIDLDEAERLVDEAEIRLSGNQPTLAHTAVRAALEILGQGRVLDDHAGDDWAVAVAREAARLVRRARAAGWRAATAIGDHRGALTWAEDAAAFDELDEEAHRAVMAAHYRLGDSGEALRAYERLRTVLVDQLGADPGPETRALYGAVLRGEPVEAEGRDAARESAAGPGDDFVGRDAEAAALMNAWEAASAGHASCALVVGEPGIGKTRLATEIGRRVGELGGLVLQTRCYEPERSLFLQPIVEIVRSAVASVATEHIARVADRPGPLAALVPELERVIGPAAYEQSAGEIERRRTFEAVASFLCGLAHRRPLLIVVDDVHNAGASTVDLLHFTQRWDPAAPLLVLATAHRSELNRRLGEVASVAQRVDLGPLPDDAVRALARRAGAPDRGDDVLRMTRGHTLFVVEALGAISEGAATDRVTDAELPVPESLRAAVEARVAKAGEDVESLLRAAVTAGSQFQVQWVAELLSTTVEEAAMVAEKARHAGLLVVGATGYEFANEVIREVVYESTPAPVRAIRHQRLAALLADQPALAADHAAAAGDWSAAATLWLAAGVHAIDTLATREAEQLFTNALKACALAEDVETTAAAHLARGRARAMVGDYTTGADDLRTAQHLARAIGASVLEAEAMVELGWCSYYARDMVHATKIAERVGANPRAGPAGQMLFAKIRHACGDLRTAAERLQVLAASDDCDTRTRALATSALAKVMLHQGDYGRASAMVDEALIAARHSGLLRTLLANRMVAIMTKGNLGDFAGALDASQSLLADADRYDVAVYRPRALNMLGWMWRELGESIRAQELAAEALEASEQVDGTFEGEPAANALLALAESALLDGDADEAVRRLGSLDSLLSDHEVYRWRVDLRRLELLCRLEPERGEELLERARTHDSTKYQALALSHLGRHDVALHTARRTGSPWLVARVAPERLARSQFDALAARLPAPLRDGFLTRSPLARHIPGK